MSDISQDISWTPLLEKYFSSVGEKSHCLSWLHNKSASLYSFRRTFIDLPVIIGSGAIAFLNAGSSSLFDDAQLASVALGIGSLVVSVLNTVTTYFGWAKRAEGHRIGALHYAKLYRFLCVEMGLPRDERMRPTDLLKTVREQYDRLAETTPDIPPLVIAEFKKKFSHPKYEDIAKPEEANGLEEITVYRPTKDSEAHLRIRIPQPSAFPVGEDTRQRTSPSVPPAPRARSREDTTGAAATGNQVSIVVEEVTGIEQSSQSSPEAIALRQDQ
jgi:hypothetical protein